MRLGEASDALVATHLGVSRSAVRRMRVAAGIDASHRYATTVAHETRLLGWLRKALPAAVELDELAALIARSRKQTTRILTRLADRGKVARAGAKFWRAR